MQITLADGGSPAQAIHEDRGDGTPVCNIPLRPLRGRPAVFTPLPAGDVSCGNRAREHSAA